MVKLLNFLFPFRFKDVQAFWGDFALLMFKIFL